MSHIKNRKKRNGRLLLIPLGAIILASVMTSIIHGHNVAPLNPKGLIASNESKLIFFTCAVLLSIAVPSVLLLYFTAWRYRESNHRAVYTPGASHSRFSVVIMWGLPTIVMMFFSYVIWTQSHKLVPQDPIASATKTLQIQVIATRWKWVFIYPQQNIATVNYVQLPMHRPVEFDLTADEAPMSAFWIPNLGGQLYAMTGMVNKLNLIADTPGSYPGSSPEINGAGFAGMQFTARTGTSEDFRNWVSTIKHSDYDNVLNDTTYAKLLVPSEYNRPAFYASSESGLYDKVLMKYMMPMGGDPQTAENTH